MNQHCYPNSQSGHMTCWLIRPPRSLSLSLCTQERLPTREFRLMRSSASDWKTASGWEPRTRPLPRCELPIYFMYSLSSPSSQAPDLLIDIAKERTQQFIWSPKVSCALLWWCCPLLADTASCLPAGTVSPKRGPPSLCWCRSWETCCRITACQWVHSFSGNFNEF